MGRRTEARGPSFAVIASMTGAGRPLDFSGQALTQAMHMKQAFSSVTTPSFPMAIAPTGQALAHLPHRVQPSEVVGWDEATGSGLYGRLPGTEGTVESPLPIFVSTLPAKPTMSSASLPSGLPDPTLRTMECSAMKAPEAMTVNPRSASMSFSSRRASSYALVP